jgi:signal peptidase I
MNILYFYLFLLIHPYLSLWFISFKQADRKSWEALIPLYNYFVAFKLGAKKPWWSLLMIVPGAHLVMWSVANTSYIRRFGYFSLVDTLQGVFFPYVIMAKIAKDKDPILPETNWANSKEMGDREWGDHLALFLALPIIGHVIALGIGAVTRHQPGKKSKVKEWGDSIIFALVAASIIRTYVFEPFQIPTGSMEKTLLVGDFLFVNKLAYGPKVPVTPLSYPLVHNTVPWVNIKSYTGLETSNYTRLPGFSEVTRNDVVVFNYPSGDTAVYDPRMPNGLMGHDYHGIVLEEAKYYWNKSFQENNAGLMQKFTEIATGTNEEINIQYYNTFGHYFLNDIDYWKDVARDKIAEGVTYSSGGMSLEMPDRIEHYGVIYRPVDKRENYIKRCVGIPGDWLEIKDAQLYVNDKKAIIHEFQNLKYYVDSILLPTDARMLEKYGLERHRGGVENGDYYLENGRQVMHLTSSELKKLKKDFPAAQFRVDVIPNSSENMTVFQKIENLRVFPKDTSINNNITNFNKFQIPFKGQTIKLTPENIAWFRRIITAYEGHTLVEKGNEIIIDGKPTKEYTFAMNYYWLMGDNRYKSADSRIWGFVPEDHVVGKASMVWFSKDPLQGIRWERLFNVIK